VRICVPSIVLAATLMVGSISSAQTSADGVAAFLRGDYALAAQTLKPIAEAWPPSTDQAAAFFMAVLYENGLGVQADPVRSCALYRRTSAGVDSPLQRLAIALPAQRDSLSAEELMECAMMANIEA
jgi:TPR repeat protein